jgi:hypothetical protein
VCTFSEYKSFKSQIAERGVERRKNEGRKNEGAEKRDNESWLQSN